MAGLTPAAVICEIMKDDGTMARLPDLEVFAREHGLKIGTIADLIEHRSRNETLIEPLGTRELHHGAGRFRCTAFRDTQRRRAPGAGRGRWATPTRCRCACTSRCHRWTCSTPGQLAFLASAVGAGGAAAGRPRRGRAAQLQPAPRRCWAAAATGAAAPQRPADGPAHLRRRRADPAPPGRAPHEAAGQPAAHAQHDRLRPRGHRLRGRTRKG
jgi:hypothetical protein